MRGNYCSSRAPIAADSKIYARARDVSPRGDANVVAEGTVTREPFSAGDSPALREICRELEMPGGPTRRGLAALRQLSDQRSALRFLYRSTIGFETR